MNEYGMGNSGGEINWVTMADPNEGTFTVQMPQGWQNQAAQVRVYDQIRCVITSQSPDGSVYLFAGDPNLPSFWEPASQMAMGMPMGVMGPMVQVQPYVPAEPFFVNYLQRRYGQAPGFQITGGSADPERERLVYEEAQRRGMRVHMTTVLLNFEFFDNGKRVQGVLRGMTMSLGETWSADVSAVLTTGDLNLYKPVFLKMVNSYKVNPQWEQMQAALHAQKMGQIQQNHQATMASMQAGHAARMDAIHQSGAVNTRIHNDRMTQGDASHQSYMDTLRQSGPSTGGYDGRSTGDRMHDQMVNYVRDEETVMDASGGTYQVETGYDRYYVNKRDNTYIGTDSTVGREDLRSRMGVNPDDYEEVKIRR